MNTYFSGIIVGFLALIMITPVHAQEKPELSIGADVVSSYVWRGSRIAGFDGINFQPYADLSYSGFSLGVWGSTNYSGEGREVDLSLGYQLGGFSFLVTDYWLGGNYFRYGKASGTHTFEGTVSCSFGENSPFSMSWSTLFYGDDFKEDGSRRYSSYLELAYGTSIRDVDLTLSLGASPWNSTWYHLDADGDLKSGFQVTSISLLASKEIKITDSFSLPLFGQIVFNPCQEDVNFVVGISL